MKVDYDEKTDILYIRLDSGSKIVNTDMLDDNILADLDKKNRIVGIEIWNASKNISEPIAKVLAKQVERTILASA